MVWLLPASEIVSFMWIFLGAGLKSNPCLKMGIITGICRVAKESIFSDLNHIQVYSLLEKHYSDKFGFTDEEVKMALAYYQMADKALEVREWYNGYTFGETVIYNPWSILSYLKNHDLKAYWVNTGSNDLIIDVISRTSTEVKRKLQSLVTEREIRDVVIDTDTNFRSIAGKGVVEEKILWSLLLISGYLNISNCRLVMGETRCDLKVPNMEIAVLYKWVISDWFSVGRSGADRIRILLENLTNGVIERFTLDFEQLVESCFSYFDVGSNTAENFYHAFILGILVNLDGKYRVLSNRESGAGRPDIMILPFDETKKGVVVEFKVAKTASEKVMKRMADKH